MRETPGVGENHQTQQKWIAYLVRYHFSGSTCCIYNTFILLGCYLESYLFNLPQYLVSFCLWMFELQEEEKETFCTNRDILGQF